MVDPTDVPHGVTVPEFQLAGVLYNVYRQERQRVEKQLNPSRDYQPERWERDYQSLMPKQVSSDVTPEAVKKDGTPRHTQLSLWCKVARELIRRRIDGPSFIRYVFYMHDPACEPVPTVQFFMSTEAYNRFYDGRKFLANEIQQAKKSQLHAFQMAMVMVPQMLRSKGDAITWAYVLNDMQVQLSALFRYCVARDLAGNGGKHEAEKFQKIVQQFEEAAALQYLFAAEQYEEHWKELLPPNYRVEAIATYDRIYQTPNLVAY